MLDVLAVLDVVGDGVAVAVAGAPLVGTSPTTPLIGTSPARTVTDISPVRAKANTKRFMLNLLLELTMQSNLYQKCQKPNIEALC